MVKALIDKGVAKVYAAMRSTAAVANLVQQYAGRVVALRLDITDTSSVAAAAEQCRDLDLLINNSGVNNCMWLLGPTGMEIARGDMEVNFFGTLAMWRAFAPLLATRGGGAIVNVLHHRPGQPAAQRHI